LRGWYGGPGIKGDAYTQLFLVGGHFSVHHTRGIAGGQDVGFVMICRQIMRATIPQGTMFSGHKGEDGKHVATDPNYVVIQVATPYGVTAPLEIPWLKTETQPGKKTGLTWTQDSIKIAFKYDGAGIVPLVPTQTWPSLAIKWDPAILGNAPNDPA